MKNQNRLGVHSFSFCVRMKNSPVLFLLLMVCGTVSAQSGSWSGGSVVDRDAVWPTTTIPVCWEEQPYDYSKEKGWVEAAIAGSWEKNSGLTFTGWGTCETASAGMRIKIDESWPRVLAFGKFINGIKNGVQLNFTFGGEFTCHRSPRACIEIIAIHEFGHALGFHHEQNRSDTDRTSRCYKEDYQGQVPNELMIGEWDLASVMNYCNPEWSGNGQLSRGDIQGVQHLYGKPEPEPQPEPRPEPDPLPNPSLPHPFTCTVRGELIQIDSQNRIFSSWNGQLLGMRVPHAHPHCSFGLSSNQGIYCVGHDGAVFAGTPQVVGYCQRN